MKIKILLLFSLFFLLFWRTNADLSYDFTYQEKIQAYILKYSDDSLKLTRVKNLLTHKYAGKNISLELKIIVNYFIDALWKEIDNQKNLSSHSETPDDVRAIYYSAYAASRSNKIEELLQLAQSTEINAIVIDIKETDGYTSFAFSNEFFWNILPKSNNRIPNISDLIEKLHQNNIYVIGRIVVFKDNYVSQNHPKFSIKWSNNHQSTWTDYKWNSYLDPYAKEVWEYNILLASESYKLWFDEINFDYVRFPTDWYISQTYYPFAHEIIDSNESWSKMKVLEAFSKYTTEKLREIHPNIILSADIFWLATHTDMYQIGQNIETFIPYFDYVAPMIYPSHYASGYLGYKVPDNAPYEIFYDSIKQAQKRIDTLNTNSSGSLNISYTKIRPWLQGFNCTWCPWATTYNREKFRKQILALNELWINSWYVWNASARYENAWYNTDD